MVIVNNILPPEGFAAINICGIIFARHELTFVTLNHEQIHSAQGRELLWIGFYIAYFLEWLVRLVICLDWKKAYRSISFEREAYEHEREIEYLYTRKRFAQWRQSTNT